MSNVGFLWTNVELQDALSGFVPHLFRNAALITLLVGLTSVVKAGSFFAPAVKMQKLFSRLPTNG